MKIKVLEILKDYEGKELLGSDNKPATVRSALALALNSQLRDEVLTAENKAKIYQLSVKLFSNDEVDLTVDDRAFIKERSGKILSPLTNGRICELLEDTEKPLP